MYTGIKVLLLFCDALALKQSLSVPEQEPSVYRPAITPCILDSIVARNSLINLASSLFSHKNHYGLQKKREVLTPNISTLRTTLALSGEVSSRYAAVR